MDEDDRTFIREQTTRMEAATRQLERAVTRMEKEMDDQRDQLRANTAATWAMVDEIKGLSS